MTCGRECLSEQQTYDRTVRFLREGEVTAPHCLHVSTRAAGDDGAIQYWNHRMQAVFGGIRVRSSSAGIHGRLRGLQLDRIGVYDFGSDEASIEGESGSGRSSIRSSIWTGAAMSTRTDDADRLPDLSLPLGSLVMG